jgi:hypothetical protein
LGVLRWCFFGIFGGLSTEIPTKIVQSGRASTDGHIKPSQT